MNQLLSFEEWTTSEPITLTTEDLDFYMKKLTITIEIQK